MVATTVVRVVESTKQEMWPQTAIAFMVLHAKLNFCNYTSMDFEPSVQSFKAIHKEPLSPEIFASLFAYIVQA